MSCLVCLPSVYAHETIIKPVSLSAEQGKTVPFSVISTHVFMVSQDMELFENVDVTMINNDTVTPITLKPNPKLMTLDGTVLCKEEGYAIISGHRKGMIYTQTTQGSKLGSKKEFKNAAGPSKNYEKFCKALIKVGKANYGYDKIINDKLEIVPMTNPDLTRINMEMEFQILYNGNPLSTEVRATYDGFSTTPNTFAYITKCNAEGIAKVKITQPGTWMVHVENQENQADQDYDVHVTRAVLVFEVK